MALDIMKEIVVFDGQDMTVANLLENASRWQLWCSVCLGAEVAAVDGIESGA